VFESKAVTWKFESVVWIPPIINDLNGTEGWRELGSIIECAYSSSLS
jgi:hypothetical protein